MADLVSLSEYKTYIGINSSDRDALMQAVITNVSDLVKTYCRRSFIDYYGADKVEYFDGGPFFDLQEYPVISITKVEGSADFGQTYTDLTNYVDYVLDKKTDTVVTPSGSAFPDLINGYRVSYRAGFSATPKDLKLGIFDLVTYYLKNDGISHSAKTVNSGTIKLEYILDTSFPAHIKRVLDLYMANYS